MASLGFDTKPTFKEWDEAIAVLARQLRLGARIIERKGFVERAVQLRDQAKLLDNIFLEAGKNFAALDKRTRTPDMIEAIESKAIAKLMRLLPALLEAMPLLAKQVAAASGSSLEDGMFKGSATDFFLGPQGRPQEGIGDGTARL